MYKQIIILFCVFSCSFVTEATGREKNVVNGSSCGELLKTPFLYQSVNVITGDYCEAHTDAISQGKYPLKIRRCFSSSEGWLFNLPLGKHTEIQSMDERVIYDYDKEHRLSSVKTNIKGDKPSTVFQFGYSEKGDNISIKVNNGAILSYNCEEQMTSRKGDSLIVSSVLVDGQEIGRYQYRQHPTQRKKLITRREGPNGNYCINEYYEGGENDVGGTTVLIEDQLRDMRVGRVKLQKGPAGNDETPIITSRFLYYPEHTEVYDALNRKSIYRYHRDGGYLNATENYTGNELYRVERVYWNRSSTTGLLHVSSKVTEDGHGCPLVCRTYDYDAHGHIIAEILVGNLSGRCTSPLILDKDKHPEKNGIESYATRLTYSSDDPGLLIRKSEDNGKVINYSYDRNTKRLTAELTGTSTLITHRRFFTYDGNGQVTMIIVDDGMSEDVSNLQGVRERHITTFTYQPDGPVGEPQVVEQKYLDLTSGKIHCYEHIYNTYNSQGKLHSQQTCDEDGKVLHDRVFTYDIQGHLINQADTKGNIEETLYDMNGNPTLSRTIEEGYPIREVHYTYDCNKRLIRSDEIDDKGSLLSSYLQYNYAGEKLASIDHFGNMTKYAYDELGRHIQTTFPAVLDQSDSLICPTISYRYDVLDNKVEEVDANGNATFTSYNVRGQPIECRYPDHTVEKYEYDLDGSLVYSISRNGLQSRYQHDFLGNPIAIDTFDTDGKLCHSVRHSYSSFHLLETIENNDLTTRYHYDGLGRVVSKLQSSAEFRRRTDYDYDRSGTLIAQKDFLDSDEHEFIVTEGIRDQDGTVTTTIKDCRGMVLKETHKTASLPVKQDEREEHIINARGQRVLQKSTTDETGTTLISVYDALGRLESVTSKDPMGELLQQVEMRYDACGNRVKMTTMDHSGQVSRADLWRYDASQRLIETIEDDGTPLIRVTRYRYNELGHLVEIVKSDGICLRHGYDSMGRIKEYSSTDGSFHYCYSYDRRGHLTEINDLANQLTISREINAFGQIVKEDLGDGLTVENEYDSLGRRQRMTLPDKSHIDYTYDLLYLNAIKRFSSEDELQYVHRYAAYSSNGEVLDISLIGNAGHLTIDYDAQRRCRKITSSKWEEEIPEDGYDANGDLVKLNFADHGGAWQAEFSYDNHHQLIEETGAFTNSYAYDARSNRINKNEHSFCVDMLDQMTGQTCSCNTLSYQYDHIGNLTNKLENDQETIYRYDALDRLIAVEAPGKSLVKFTYDGFHRRLSKHVNEWDAAEEKWNPQHTWRYLYDGDREIGALDEKGNIVEMRVLGIGYGAEIGAAVAHEIQGKAYAPIHDHRGTVCCLVDAQTGETAEYYRYTSFGEVQVYGASDELLDASAVHNPWLFSSKRFDAETGLVFYGKRYYDAQAGRWLTKDPLGQFDGPNPYVFLHNNPLSMIDLYGLFSISAVWDLFSSAVSVVSNSVVYAIEYSVESLYRFRKNFSYTNQIDEEWNEVAEQIFGGGFLQFAGYYRDILSTGVYNPGHEISDNVRITLINGILNVRTDLESSMQQFSSTHGGNTIHYVFHPTQGWSSDVINGFLVKMGYVSSEAKLLATTWKKLIREMGGISGDGKIIHYAHSIGASDTYMAVKLLSAEEKRMIHIITIGSPSLIPQETGFASVTNYVSKRDGVCLLDPIAYFNAWLSEDSNVSFLGSFWGIPFIDHTLYTESYSTIIRELGEEFLYTYRPLAP